VALIAIADRKGSAMKNFSLFGVGLCSTRRVFPQPATPWRPHAISLCPRGRGTPLAGAARRPGVLGKLRTRRSMPSPSIHFI
jgi:hypothetical protein